ncbi:MAG TPA: ABC transporter ATP-binding protein [Candidatus Scatomonas merdigallinarum]|nr:ABC transporter ATP-binding protein [Candidatus Scatomonas merdigallinarum]
MELLKLEHVFLSYHTPGGETPVLDDISFSLEQGTFTAVVGPSGCGKSTILNLISGLIRPESGRVFIEGKSLSQSELNIGYMLQKDHLFEWRTVESNVLLGLEIQHKADAKNRARVDRLLKAYGLSPFKHSRPSQLSGGMRQRAALIRTLALDPALLLLDEPFSALDYQTRLSVSDDIWQIIRREKKTALLVTHDISEAVSMADQVIVLTRRPARIRRVIPITFKLPERTPMASRDMPEFKQYFNLIWKELNSHE